MERRQLFWSKLGDARRAATLFADLDARVQEVAKAAGAELAASIGLHFTKAKTVKVLTEAERIGAEVGAIGGVLKAGSLTFLDQRRWNNLAIALTKLGLSNDEIRRAVVDADESVLTPDALDLLVQVTGHHCRHRRRRRHHHHLTSSSSSACST